MLNANKTKYEQCVHKIYKCDWYIKQQVFCSTHLSHFWFQELPLHSIYPFPLPPLSDTRQEILTWGRDVDSSLQDVWDSCFLSLAALTQPCDNCSSQWFNSGSWEVSLHCVLMGDTTLALMSLVNKPPRSELLPHVVSIYSTRYWAYLTTCYRSNKLFDCTSFPVRQTQP